MNAKYLKIMAVIGSLGLASLPPLSVHQGLQSNAEKQGEQLVQSLAKTMIRRADAHVERSLKLLSQFALLAISDCQVKNLTIMRRTSSNYVWIGEIGIVGKDGHLKCNQFGEPEQFIERVPGLASDVENVTVEIVQRKDAREKQTMLTWALASGDKLAAFLPGEALAYDIIPKRMRNKGVALVTLTDGSLLYMAPRQRDARAELPFDDRTFSHTEPSAKYPFRVSVLAPFDVIWEDIRNLYQNLMAGAVVLSTIIVALVLFLVRPKAGRVNEIEAGIEKGEFIPFYQPTFDLQTGMLRGCEVLIRWQKPDGQILPPGTFIGLAEATGLAIPMTLSLMERVVEDMEDLHENRPDLKIGINLFDDHFESLDIVKDVETIFGPSKIDYNQLMFEVTERQPLTDIETAKVVIRNMRSLGCKVALDDAGTGHGGLAYLQQLGFDVIKIDKLFIDAIGTDSLSAPIVDSLISLAEGLDMEIVAEGVEEPMQVEYLREKGVRLAQGYLFAKPLPYETYKRLIEKMVPLIKPPEERRRASAKAQYSKAA